MNIQTYFPHVRETAYSYQHTIIASRDAGVINTPQFAINLRDAGFFTHSWMGQILL
jgi:hypothetical protein